MTLTLADLNRLGPADFAAAIGDVFELAPWVAQEAHAKRPFATVTYLHAAMMGAVRAKPREAQVAFLGQHPDLAGKAARSGAITDDSRREQASAGLDALPEEEFERFHRLNDAYKAKFGFPFIVCVRRHTRDSILAATIVLDLALFGDLAKRAGMKGIQEWLSFYFKSPQHAASVYPEHDLFAQKVRLENNLRYLIGEELINYLGSDYTNE